jgi:hypothetical protein
MNPDKNAEHDMAFDSDLALHHLAVANGLYHTGQLPEISDELKELLERFATGQLGEAEESRMFALALQEPAALAYLNRIPDPDIEDEIDLENLELDENALKMRDECLALLPQVSESIDIWILLDRDSSSISFKSIMGGSEIPQYELAHSTGNAKSVLTHRRELGAFHIMVTVATEIDDGFALSIVFERNGSPIDGVATSVRLTQKDAVETFESTKPIVNARVKFEGLQAGSYQIEILIGAEVDKQFTLKLEKLS